MSIIINSVKVDDTMTIEFVSNPKRPGFKAHARYELYGVATTIAEFFEIVNENELLKKYGRADLRYDEEHGHLKIFNEDGEQINTPTES